MKKRSVAKRRAKYKTTKKIHQKGGMPNLLLSLDPDGSRVKSVAFHPTKPFMATCTSSGTVKVWSMSVSHSHKPDLKLAHELTKPRTCSYLSVAFHPSSPLLGIGCTDGSVRLCKMTENYTLLASPSVILEGHSSRIHCLAFHPTAQLLATGSDDTTVKLWRMRIADDHSSADCVATLGGEPDGHRSLVRSVAFHLTEPFIASGSYDNTAKIWRIADNYSSAKCVATLSGHTGVVECVAFHPKKMVVATGSGDNSVKIWGLADGIASSSFSAAAVPEPLVLATLTGHTDIVYSLSFHPKKPILASGSGDKTVKLWLMLPDFQCITTLEGHSNWVFSVAFHPTKKILASGSGDNTVKLWDYEKSSTLFQRNWSLRTMGALPRLLARRLTGNSRSPQRYHTVKADRKRIEIETLKHVASEWAPKFLGKELDDAQIRGLYRILKQQSQRGHSTRGWPGDSMAGRLMLEQAIEEGNANNSASTADEADFDDAELLDVMSKRSND
ncbi:MAG: WD40 repeat domain-containing protein [Bacteroidetes bacterium]|nr:WD40 repeat domain-containing protein [bacterium]NBP65456.1 WD40 repeat domain-containing protein [Bacteroidota bacterium]